jgi:hypothetical protein
MQLQCRFQSAGESWVQVSGVSRDAVAGQKKAGKNIDPNEGPRKSGKAFLDEKNEYAAKLTVDDSSDCQK